jgi:aquaporin Z
MSQKNSSPRTWRWFGAEFVGTLLLAATAGVVSYGHAGLLSGYETVYVPAVVGLLIMVLVYAIGGISGCHLNPAVSVALYAFRKISLNQLWVHVLAQLLGAFAGAWLVGILTAQAVMAPAVTGQAVMVGEFAGAFVLVWVITMAVLGKISAPVTGVAIGGALTIGLSLAMVAGGGVLNPAIAIAFGIRATEASAYVLMPLLGGLAGAALGTLLADSTTE